MGGTTGSGCPPIWHHRAGASLNAQKNATAGSKLGIPSGDALRAMTRFNPGNAHVCGLSRHGALVGFGELDGDQTKAGGHKVYPGSAPLVG
jgi:hypothetical protein